jgi:TatD DNase family protein
MLFEKENPVFIDVHTHQKKIYPYSNIQVINIEVNKNEKPAHEGLISVGWHPWDADKSSVNDIQSKLENAVQWSGVVALGECGIDRASKVDIGIQKAVFELHMVLSFSEKLPLVVHCVRAYSDLFEVLKKHRFDGKIIFHAYHANETITKQLLNYDSYFSFGQQLYLENIGKIFEKIPSNRIFIETDVSEIKLFELYQKAAEIKAIDLLEFQQQVKNNFAQIF